MFAGSGRLGLPEAAVFAFGLGCDLINVGREALLAIGCIQAQRCHTNHCPTGITTHDPELQRGLVPENKATRVKNYALNLMHEVGVIAHSCGVKEARALTREHVYLIDNNGSPEPLTYRYPEKTPKPEYLIASTADNMEDSETGVHAAIPITTGKDSRPR